MSHRWMSHVILMNNSCNTYECVMPYAICMHASCHTCEGIILSRIMCSYIHVYTLIHVYSYIYTIIHMHVHSICTQNCRIYKCMSECVCKYMCVCKYICKHISFSSVTRTSASLHHTCECRIMSLYIQVSVCIYVHL